MQRLLKYLPTPVLLGLAGLALFAAGRCTGPGPGTPSQDSTSLRQYADSVLRVAARESAHRDSVRNATLDSVLGTADSLRRITRQQAQRLAHGSKPVQPTGTASDSVTWLLGRVDTLEQEKAGMADLLETTVVRDSMALDSVAGLFHVQQAETARLRGLLLASADSLGQSAVKIGALERKLHRSGSGTHVGVIAGASYAGGCWTGMAGPEVEQRGKWLIFEGEASVAGGIGVGGCGRIPTSSDQAKVGAAGQVRVRVGF